MKKIVLLLGLLVLWGCSSQEPIPGRIDWAKGGVDRGQQFVQAIVDGEYATAMEHFNAAVSSEFSRRKLIKRWEEIIAEAGAFESFVGTEHLEDPAEVYDIYVVTAKHELKHVVVRLVIETNKNVDESSLYVSGLVFRVEDPDADTDE